MKVYGSPPEVALPQPDYKNYNREAEQAKVDAYMASLKAWLASKGYKGTNSGKVVKFQVADGYAEYMVAENGKQFFLIHLPLYDAYQYANVRYLPKKEILAMIARDAAWDKMFADAKAKRDAENKKHDADVTAQIAAYEKGKGTG